ncbi:hypothetical protein OROGR_027162 [Orobanche gracilis]
MKSRGRRKEKGEAKGKEEPFFTPMAEKKHHKQSYKSTVYLFPVVEHKRISIQNRHRENLVGILHETGSHELDRIPMSTLAFAFEREGMSAFRFDFAGNGESEGSFQYANYRREAEDLSAVVEHFQKDQRLIAALIGHSKRGNAVLLYASRYHDVHKIVNIAGRFNLSRGIEGRLGQDFLEKIKQYGFIDVKNRKGKTEYRVTKESLIDRLATDTRAACETIPQCCRVLTVHGTLDEFVPVEDAVEFAKYIKNHNLRIVEGADHEYTKHQSDLASIVLSFVKTGLNQDKTVSKPLSSCSRPKKCIDSCL